MKTIIQNKRLVGVGVVLAALAVAGGATFLNGRSGSARAETVAAAPAALPVSVSGVVPRETVPWGGVFGPLEAGGRGEDLSRVAGAVAGIHFREGVPLQQGA